MAFPWRTALALCIGAAMAGSAIAVPDRQPDAAAVYTVTPEMKNGKLVALGVELQLIPQKSGIIQLDLPDKGMGLSGRWKYLSDFSIRGAQMRSRGPATRLLTGKAGEPIVIHYRVHSAYAADPASGNPYNGAVIRPAWFASLGDFVFILPHGWDDRPAAFRWGGIPKGWRVASDLEHGAMGRPMAIGDIGESTMLGGPDVEIYRRDVPDGRVRLAVRGKWKFSNERFADLIARLVSAQRAFWGHDVRGPFLVTFFQLAGTGSSGGTGRSDAFALYATRDIDAGILTRIIAHEHTHTWIPRRIGDMPEKDEAADYWFSEGFTDFYAERTLLKSGIWSLDDFANDLNTKLMEYGSSPARNASNARIVKEFWTNDAVEHMPYQRGMLLAYIWDHRLHAQSRGKKNLDDVMFAARDRYAAAAAAHKPQAVANFLQSYRRVSGADLPADLSRYVQKGGTVALPTDMFGLCASVHNASAASFDRGFDVDKTAETGIFAQVDPAGPA